MPKLQSLLINICLCSFLLYSCENPKVELTEDEIVSGTPHIGGGDPPIPTPNDPGPAPGPSPVPGPDLYWNVEISARKVDKEDLRDFELPYKTSFFKTIDFGKRVKKKKEIKKCHKEHEKKCVVNKQVLFKFNLKRFSELDISDYDVKNLTLKGDFYSIGKNHKNEILCVLNRKLYRCSGRPVDSFPNIGLRFLAKMLYWNMNFWGTDYEDIIDSTFFSDQFINSSYDDETNTYVLKNKEVKFNRAFRYSPEEYNDLVNVRELFFLVADDTYVGKNIKLIINMRKKK